MKLLLLSVSLFLLPAGIALGSAPEKLDGCVYYEGARTIAHTSYSFAVRLSADGSYLSLYSTTTGLPVSPSRLLDPIDGTFIYRKLDDTTAELTLFEARSGSGRKRILNFTSGTNGSMVTNSFDVGNFVLSLSGIPAPLVNCSNRSFIATGGKAYSGFVVSGDSPRIVLVRAAGPALASFQVTAFLRNPTLRVVRASDNLVLGSNDDWSSESAAGINRAGALVGAFPFSAASKDSALLVRVEPGAYIAEVTSVEAGDAGEALIEIYVLP